MPGHLWRPNGSQDYGIGEGEVNVDGKEVTGYLSKTKSSSEIVQTLTNTMKETCTKLHTAIDNTIRYNDA